MWEDTMDGFGPSRHHHHRFHHLPMPLEPQPYPCPKYHTGTTASHAAGSGHGAAAPPAGRGGRDRHCLPAPLHPPYHDARYGYDCRRGLQQQSRHRPSLLRRRGGRVDAARPCRWRWQCPAPAAGSQAERPLDSAGGYDVVLCVVGMCTYVCGGTGRGEGALR